MIDKDDLQMLILKYVRTGVWEGPGKPPKNVKALFGPAVDGEPLVSRWGCHMPRDVEEK